MVSKSRKRRHEPVEEPEEEIKEEEENEEEEDELEEDATASSENGSESGGSSSEGEQPKIEYLVTNRSRRANAGNKMSSLIESTSQEDDFYKSAYGGGFNEDDVDEVFESPVHSDVDEVDSDFDKSEEEDEPISGDEEGKEKRVRKKNKFKEPLRGSQKQLLDKNKWAIARFATQNGVAANRVDAKTQAERLKEAEETEAFNVASLKKYEQFELETKKKREKTRTIRVLPPFISVKSRTGCTEMVVPDVKTFRRPTAPIPFICAVTGRPAKYRDPVTNLPYATPFAFKVIRDKYYKYLKTIKNNPEVDEFLKQFE